MKKTSNIKNPLVSVIMPVYNASLYIEQAIKSILNQTYSNYELIIVDDHSKDDSRKIISRYRKLYPDRIKVIALKKNLNRGGDACANIAIKKAKGKYIARLDADDIAIPKRLEKQVTYLEKYQDVFALGGQADVINMNGKIIGEKNVPINYEDIYYEYFNIHPIIHSTLTFRNPKNNSNFYKIKFSANNDYYTLFSLLTKGKKITNLDKKLVKYRIHGKNDTFINIREKLWNTIKIKVEMIIKNSYQPDVRQYFKLVSQVIIALFIPEKIIYFAYLYFKGIKKITNPFRAISLPKINLYPIRKPSLIK